jgi:hypothetical protein
VPLHIADNESFNITDIEPKNMLNVGTEPQKRKMPLGSFIGARSVLKVLQMWTWGCSFPWFLTIN